MFNYCGIDFVEGPSGLWVPDPAQRCYGGLHAYLQQVYERGGSFETSKGVKEFFDGMEFGDNEDYGPSNEHPWFTDDDPANLPEVQQHIEEHRNHVKRSARVVNRDRLLTDIIELKNRRFGNSGGNYLSDFITDGPLSDSTIEDFLDE